MTRFIIALGALALLACEPADESHGPGYNKGCSNPTLCTQSYDPNSNGATPDPPPPFDPPAGCPKTRSDSSRTGLTASEIGALLPGHYLSCSDDQTIDIRVTEDGRLVADRESFFIVTCGSARCDAVWGRDVGTLQIWTDPTAFTFTGDLTSGESSASYVRSPD